MASPEDTNWRDAAKCEQIQNAGLFNKMDVCSIDVLKTRIAICLFGLPDDLEEKCSEWDNLSFKQYNKKQNIVIEKISQCILNHQRTFKEDQIYLSFVAVLGRTKKRNEKNFMEWVFKVPGKDGREEIFIDRNCRVYQGWNDYLTNNTLPKATLCFPVDGKYPDEGCSPRVAYADTPSCNVAHDVLFGVDIATSVTTVVGSTLLLTGLFVPIAAPFVWTAFAITAASGMYGAGRSIETLVDRGRHHETLNPINSAARSAWLGATIPFLGLAAGAASAVAATARFTNLGLEISQAGRIAINVTNGVNCVAQGVCLANDVYNIIETSINGDQVSLIQIFQCIASLLFFANTVVSSYQARLILQSLNSKGTTGGIDNLFTKVSKWCKTEYGICVRPTNVLSLNDLAGFVSMNIRWDGMILKVTSGICESIEKIFDFLSKNRSAEFKVIAKGIYQLLKELWKKLQQHSLKHAYDYESPQLLSNVFNTSNTSFKEADETNGTENVKKDADQITIVGMNVNGDKKQFQKIIEEMLVKEEVSELEVLENCQFIFQQIKKEIEEKEMEFQTRLNKNKMNEKQLENLLGIEGERAQYFANEVMKSYGNLKIIASKQDYRRMIQKTGMKIPLYSLGSSPVEILYFHSVQKHGTRLEKYVKILQNANINTSSKTCFCFENSCFIDLNDKQSQYKMAGVVNFAESDDDMMGIIITVKNK